MGCDRPQKIDLHVHSSASDGSLTPDDLLALAAREDLCAISITDHDTLDGTKHGLRLTAQSKISFLTGVEISAAAPDGFDVQGSLHILGYGIDPENVPLNRELDRFQKIRQNRSRRIIERLGDLGLDLDIPATALRTEEGQFGRPHIAQAMVRKGYVASIDEAFDRYLGKGQTAYVDKYRPPCNQTIDLILEAGGVAVLAHPFLYGIPTSGQLEKMVIALKKAGMAGLEVFYPQHTLDQTARLAYWAGRHQLLMTGGSDFHGDLNPHIKLGHLTEETLIPDSLYPELAAACIGTPPA